MDRIFRLSREKTSKEPRAPATGPGDQTFPTYLPIHLPQLTAHPKARAPATTANPRPNPAPPGALAGWGGWVMNP